MSLAGLTRCALLLELLDAERGEFLEFVCSPEYEAALATDDAFVEWIRELLDHDLEAVRRVRHALLDARTGILSACSSTSGVSGGDH